MGSVNGAAFLSSNGVSGIGSISAWNMKQVGIVWVRTHGKGISTFSTVRALVISSRSTHGNSSTYVSTVLYGTYSRLDHEAFEAFYTSSMKGYEMLLVTWDHASIKSHVYEALASRRTYFNMQIFHSRCRR